MDTIPLWCIIFINCITLLSSVWILIYLYRNRSKKSFSTYIYGIASLIGLFLGVISFFYYICHAFCAILFGIEIFIDTYMEQKKSPVNRTYFKITIPHPYVLKGYYCGIGFMFYGIMVILSWYKQKYVLQLQVIKDNYATFAVPYNGEDNNDYVDGKGFCCNDGSLEAAQARALSRAAKNNFQEGDAYEKMQFYYHPDHLGSSSYITNLNGEVVQHIEYVPFGEVFVEERNNISNNPLRRERNGKR